MVRSFTYLCRDPDKKGIVTASHYLQVGWIYLFINYFGTGHSGCFIVNTGRNNSQVFVMVFGQVTWRLPTIELIDYLYKWYIWEASSLCKSMRTCFELFSLAKGLNSVIYLLQVRPSIVPSITVNITPQVNVHTYSVNKVNIHHHCRHVLHGTTRTPPLEGRFPV